MILATKEQEQAAIGFISSLHMQTCTCATCGCRPLPASIALHGDVVVLYKVCWACIYASSFLSVLPAICCLQHKQNLHHEDFISIKLTMPLSNTVSKTITDANSPTPFCNHT